MATTNFVPARHGFNFTNSFRRLPDLPEKNLLGNLADKVTKNISIKYGLCGGMSLASRDFFLHDRRIPDRERTPQSGRLFDYLWDRQIDSFDKAHSYRLLRRFVHFYLPTTFTREQSVDEVKAAKREIDSGMPALLGLVYVRAPKGIIWDNHQVLAHSYHENGKTTVFGIYDPNEPNENDIQIFATRKKGHPLRPNKLWMDMKQIDHSEINVQEVIGLICMDVPTERPPRNL